MSIVSPSLSTVTDPDDTSDCIKRPPKAIMRDVVYNVSTMFGTTIRVKTEAREGS